MNLNLSIVSILALLNKQIQGLLDRPDLAAEVPVSVARLQKAVAAAEALKKRQRAADLLYHRLTEVLQEEAFALRELFNSNVLAIGSKYGKYAPELRAVGAKPLKGSRRSKAEPAAGEASAAPPETPAGDTEGKVA